ncbi:MAG: carboxymuconolactone decarboxylase family protein [Nanoarchaeota archaeon]
MDYAKMNQETGEYFQDMGKLDADKLKAFRVMHGDIMEGVLDKKTKELMAIALALVAPCAHCIALHVKAAMDLGMTREELSETIWVATLMGGGPALMHGKEALQAFDQFFEE